MSTKIRFSLNVLTFFSLFSLSALAEQKLQGLQNIDSEVKSARTKLSYIIKEILNSETSYLNSVAVTSNFKAALDSRLNEIRDSIFLNHDLLIDLSTRLHRLSPDEILEEGQHFVQQMNNIVTGLQDQTMDSKQAYSNVLDVLETHFHAVPKLYLPYFLSYRHASELLQEIEEKGHRIMRRPHARAREEISRILDSLDLKKPNGQKDLDTNHAINSSLIAPAQRLPRYQLLLQDLIKTAANAGIDAGDAARGDQVLDLIKGTLADLNSKIE
jgi:hypothetical protein